MLENPSSRDVHINAEYSAEQRAFRIYVWARRQGRDETAVVDPPVFRELKPEDEAYEIPDTFLMTKDHAQPLMDDLWHAGVRPSSQEYTAETIKAKDEHIKDFRSVVDRLFGLIGKD